MSQDLQTFTEELNLGLLEFEINDTGNYVVKKVNKFGSFGKAGIAPGDEILALQGQPSPSEAVVLELLRQAGVGNSVTYRIRRANQVFDLPVLLLKKRTLSFEIDEVDAELERKIAP